MRDVSYIGPERQLPLPAGVLPLTTNEAVVLVVDDLLKKALQFRHTHLKQDLLSILERALYLEMLGYQLIWDRTHGVVGAHRKEKPDSCVH